MVTAIVGANWGDEGKGKITDMLGEESDIIVRFQGGSNAGHTIINDYGKFALHLLPSGVFYDHTTSIIGNGVALNIPYLFNEINEIVKRGVPKPKILVSDRAQILMPYHIAFDQYEEERLGKASFGSTKSGIAPFYSDKYAKIGIQVSELFADDEVLRDKVNRICEQKNVILKYLYNKPELKPDELIATLHEYRDMIAPYVCNVSAYLREAIKEGKNILLEGQLGSLKDPDHGIYPMVTSSSTSRYGCQIQGATDVVLTVLDCLGYLKEIPVCVGYEIDGEVVKEFPVTAKLAKAKPVYEVLPGWACDISGIKEYDKLPENCRKYIEFIEKELGVPITMVSNGPKRTDIIYRNK